MPRGMMHWHSCKRCLPLLISRFSPARFHGGPIRAAYLGDMARLKACVGFESESTLEEEALAEDILAKDRKGEVEGAAR